MNYKYCIHSCYKKYELNVNINITSIKTQGKYVLHMFYDYFYAIGLDMVIDLII